MKPIEIVQIGIINVDRIDNRPTNFLTEENRTVQNPLYILGVGFFANNPETPSTPTTPAKPNPAQGPTLLERLQRVQTLTKDIKEETAKQRKKFEEELKKKKS